MNSPIHILVTVRNPELWQSSFLVFKTLRKGFPNNPVRIYGNGLSGKWDQAALGATQEIDGIYTNLRGLSHDAWIAGLLAGGNEPFWICDTDMVFWNAVPSTFNLQPSTIFAGRYQPEFVEPWTNSIHAERLETCLAWFDPAPLRAAMREHAAHVGEPWRDTMEHPFIRQTMVPRRGRLPLFYDTLAGLWQAGIGTPFDAAQDASFAHLYCGTYAEKITAATGGGLLDFHKAIWTNPELARECSAMQADYYERQRVTSHS